MTTSTTLPRPPTNRSGDSAPWLTDGPTPRRSRLRPAGRRRSVPHLVLGVLLVLASAVGAILLLSRSTNRETVLALARPVPVGHVLTAADLREVSIPTDSGLSVVDAGQAGSVVGRTMADSVPAGALLTPAATSSAALPGAGQAIASLALKPGQFPVEVAAGAAVAVVLVPNQAGSSATAPEAGSAGSTVWPAVVTSTTPMPDQQVTVVSVELSKSAAVQVAAVPAGELSLVLTSDGGR